MNLADLAARAQLLAIEVVGCQSERMHDGTVGPLRLPVDFEASIETQLRIPDAIPAGGMLFLAGAKATWRDSVDVIAWVEVTLRLAYGTPYDVPREIMTRFGLEVAGHQVWPFFRERIRTASVELGMPPLLLALKPKPT